ncbi:non-hydrolyzing UDP-N-acetylglucosamine 2-epimerase [uncultured Alistipes sp.]|uniref:non-hydrolyzing UDP-N-acetylglucosamine 2-epimerase n=1 Tax=uncultured Alistipes sp. TaxID=538949 RepID=UPI002616AF89|nr:UDP-N-acetylglucosamine 2-epimerase (non-hydrolyzing) [uncultured Alistipes sp.]
MKKLKLMTIVGTRPEIIKMSAIIKMADKYFDHILVHTGQNFDYSLNEIFFKDLGLRAPDYCLSVVGENIGQTMGNIISKSYDLMTRVKPDAVIVLGDTNSCLSILSAKRLKIPVFHMEAGNRCKDENLPEEIIRRIIDVSSDINLCYSEHARRYILQSGVKPEYTFVVGSPMAEVLHDCLPQIQSSLVLETLGLKAGKYILLSAHREENIDIEKNFISLMTAVNILAKTFDVPILYSCHPRSKKYIEQRKFKFDHRIIQHQPLGFFDYNKLQQNALCVISDSGTLPEESAFFHFPAVSLRTSTERPEAIDEGVFTIGNITPEQVLQAVNMTIGMHSDNGVRPSPVSGYIDRNVSMKVCRIIQSYTGIINTMIWKK